MKNDGSFTSDGAPCNAERKYQEKIHRDGQFLCLSFSLISPYLDGDVIKVIFY
jgi:hypothetical protein